MAKLPPARACLIAEQVRPEPNNKSTLIGFLGMSPLVKIGLSKIPGTVQLSALILCGAFEDLGDPQIEVEILSPSKTLLTRRRIGQDQVAETGREAAVALNLGSMPVEEIGLYKIRLYSLNEFHSEHHITIAYGPNMFIPAPVEQQA